MTAVIPAKLSIVVVAVALTVALSSMSKAQTPNVRIQITADEMCCNGCAQKVAAQLYAAPGVTSVEANVPNRLVTVTAKPSPKLTYERLWAAVEKANGAPSKLVAQTVTYALTKSANLKAEQRMAANQYALVVRRLESREGAQDIANQLYAVNGVQSVSLDLTNQRLVIQSAAGTILSPWALAAAAETAQHEPTSVNGPYGLMTIERPAKTASGSSAPSQPQGGIR